MLLNWFVIRNAQHTQSANHTSHPQQLWVRHILTSEELSSLQQLSLKSQFCWLLTHFTGQPRLEGRKEPQKSSKNSEPSTWWTLCLRERERGRTDAAHDLDTEELAITQGPPRNTRGKILANTRFSGREPHDSEDVEYYWLAASQYLPTTFLGIPVCLTCLLSYSSLPPYH